MYPQDKVTKEPAIKTVGIGQNWLPHRVFDTYDAIIDAVCKAWNNLID